MILSDKEKHYLLKLAFTSVRSCVGDTGKSSSSSAPVPPSLTRNQGAFVSIYIDDRLRGCIGTFTEEEPLYRNVKNMAISAASCDSRFEPVRYEELDTMRIEIHVLSVRKRIKDIKELIPGMHGIYMVKGSSRGTLLPQVATQEGWNVEEFLGHCARYKAGIGWEGWKTAELYIYETDVIDSRQIPVQG